MQKIIIKHLAGSKANQTDAFDLPISEITFGRENTCQVIFDPERDPLISRVHCKLIVQNENEFLLTDLNSSNGTYVNGEKISTPRLLRVTDKIQLGQNGAKFEFDLNPRPSVMPPPTIHERPVIDPTIKERPIEPSSSAQSGQEVSAKSNNIGRGSVERRIAESQALNQKNMRNIGAGIIGLLILGGTYLGYQIMQSKNDTDNKIEISKKDTLNTIKGDLETQIPKRMKTASDIFKEYADSTVLINVNWKLTHLATGKQIYQRVACLEQKKNCEPLPWYILYKGAVEPFLDYEGNPIGGSGSGSGFVVKENGFILTNRHVAASWHTQFNNLQLPGILQICDDNDEGCSKPSFKILENDPNDVYVKSLAKWVPSGTRFFGDQLLNEKIVEGSNEVMDVMFQNSGLKYPARLVGVSDSADVALIKVDVPKNLHPVKINSSESISAGDGIAVLGYPGVSDIDVERTKSEDPFGNQAGEIRVIPVPTVSTGNIGKITEKTLNNSTFNAGESFQLTVNSTGAGNSGGPVFNDKGSVVGIFTRMKSDENGTTVTFATPIKYGEEIMGISKPTP